MTPKSAITDVPAKAGKKNAPAAPTSAPKAAASVPASAGKRGRAPITLKGGILLADARKAAREALSAAKEAARQARAAHDDAVKAHAKAVKTAKNAQFDYGAVIGSPVDDAASQKQREADAKRIRDEAYAAIKVADKAVNDAQKALDKANAAVQKAEANANDVEAKGAEAKAAAAV